MDIEIREVKKEDKHQVELMYEEYMKSDLTPGIDRFEGVRNFENFDKMSFEQWMEDLEKNKDEKQLPKDYSTNTLYLAVNENKEIVGAIRIKMARSSDISEIRRVYWL